MKPSRSAASGDTAAKSRTRAALLLGMLVCGLAVAVAGITLARREADPAGGAPAGYAEVTGTAIKYAQLLQTGQVQQALFMVNWVQERLERVRAGSAAADAENEAMAAMVAEASLADRSRAVLLEEGIEDQYIFVPRAQIEIAGADAGRAGLEKPVAGRVWLRVTFTDPASAPKSMEGRAVRRLTAGLNISQDQRILKSEIVGNLEIDRFSIAYF